tara:strand:- start:247 stop:450 length:204 start_codon:yes stop_codon:yes gene_type:complete
MTTKALDIAQLGVNASTIKTVFNDNQIAHNEVQGFDAQVNSLASTLDVSVEDNAKETAIALAIALGG